MNKITFSLVLALIYSVMCTPVHGTMILGFEFESPSEIQEKIANVKTDIKNIEKKINDMGIPEIDKMRYRSIKREDVSNLQAVEFTGQESLLNAKQTELKKLEKQLLRTQVTIGSCIAIPVILVTCAIGAYFACKKPKNKDGKKDIVANKLTKVSEVA